MGSSRSSSVPDEERTADLLFVGLGTSLLILISEEVSELDLEIGGAPDGRIARAAFGFLGNFVANSCERFGEFFAFEVFSGEAGRLKFEINFLVETDLLSLILLYKL